MITAGAITLLVVIVLVVVLDCLGELREANNTDRTNGDTP